MPWDGVTSGRPWPVTPTTRCWSSRGKGAGGAASTGTSGAIEAFLRSFLDAGIVGEAHDILVNGPPWRTTVCVLFTDRAHSAAGDIVYENRAILFDRVVWGKIVYHEDFEDTHKSEAFDRYLAARRASLS